MKALVTGGAGFIGSHVVDLFLEHGLDVVVVDNLSTGRRQNLNPRATFYELDIRDPALENVFQDVRPDYVSHHAAQIDVRRSVADPLFDADVNIMGSLRLLEYARHYEVRHFVYISSGGAVYGEPDYLPCDEAHPIHPICQYGASKHIIEHYLYMYEVLYGLPYTALRYANVYGPRQDPHGEAGVVAIFTGRMLSGAPATVNGDGEQTRDFVYVGDCSRANLLALTAPHPSGEYNIGAGRETSINELFATMKSITGYPREALHGPAKLGETQRIYLDCSKAAQALGWRPQVSLEEGLRRTVAHFQNEE